MSDHESLRQRLERSSWLPRPIEEVFAFFADATNLERITPPELRFRIVSPLPIEMRQGALIEYRLALFRVPFGWRTEISEWSPPSRFVDRQIAGPYRSWIHVHSFSTERRGTRMHDQVDYVLPLGAAGRLAAPLVRRELDRIFDYRARAIGALLT